MPAGCVPCVLLKLKPGFSVRLLQLNAFSSMSSKHQLPAQMVHCAQRRLQIWTTGVCPSASSEHPPHYPLRPGRPAWPAANSCQGTPVIESSCQPGALKPSSLYVSESHSSHCEIGSLPVLHLFFPMCHLCSWDEDGAPLGPTRFCPDALISPFLLH